MWSPHPLQGYEQYAQWNSVCRGVGRGRHVHPRRKPQALPRFTSIGPEVGPRSWAQASKALWFRGGPRTKVTDGDTIWA